MLMYFVQFQFIFSTAVDGKIKAWLYDNLGSRVDYDAPGHSCTTMAYSADGTRYNSIFCSFLSRFWSSLGMFYLFLLPLPFPFWQMVGYSPVVRAKMVNHTLWSGMRVKGL